MIRADTYRPTLCALSCGVAICALTIFAPLVMGGAIFAAVLVCAALWACRGEAQ